MSFDNRDSDLSSLAKLGRASAFLHATDPSKQLDELQRKSSVVADVVARMKSDQYRGPRFGDDADLFTMDARAASSGYNQLSGAEAASDGFPGSIAGLFIYRHGRGFVLDNYVIIRHVLGAPVLTGSVPTRIGGVLLYYVDDNRTVFQFDVDSRTQEAVITVICWPSKAVPTNGLSPSVTGASRGPSGGILATEL